MAETIGTAYVQIEPTFKGNVPKIDQAFGGEGEKAGHSFASGFATVLGSSAKVMGAAVAAGGTAVAGMVKSAVEGFGEYEQLVGGLETMFEDLSWDVEQNAGQAFKTAGLSANEYMETVMGFSAALTSSLQDSEGNIARSADLSDQIVRDMADNANKMGSSMESIQNAYAGFAKQNYTMLDNLKLGYGGTKSEMERLLADAKEFSGVDYNIDSFADVAEAIHVIQDNMGITGTTAKEASSTIQGSLASVAAAWQNVLAGMGNSEADMGALIDNLVSSAEDLIGNLMPVIEQALTGVSTLIAQMGPVIAEKLPALLQSVLPMLLTSAAQIVQTLAQGIIAAIPALLPTVTTVITDLVNMFISMLPQLIELGAQVLIALATGLAESLPTLVPTIIDVVATICQYLLENIDLLLEAAGELVIGLATGIIAALPVLIEKVPVLIVALVKAIISLIPKLVEVGKKLLISIKDAFTQAFPQFTAKVKALFTTLIAAIRNVIKNFVDIGKSIVDGIKKGISSAWEGMTKWFANLLNGLVDGVKKFFGISSPSKLMAEEVGQWIPAGIAQGISQGMKTLKDEYSNMNLSLNPMKQNLQTMNTYTPEAVGSADVDAAILNLLRRYLPEIANGEVNISLEGDLGRLFRAMQHESIRNTQIVGTSAVLSAT